LPRWDTRAPIGTHSDVAASGGVREVIESPKHGKGSTYRSFTYEAPTRAQLIEHSAFRCFVGFHAGLRNADIMSK
jgi:hypothetical protein